MAVLQQVAFVIILGVAVFFIRKRVLRLRDNIRLGKKAEITDRKDERLKNVLLIAFGQKKMFKRPVPALLHFLIYAGFLIINIEVLEFVIDGIAGTHRIFAPFLGGIYPWLMNFFEFLAAGVLLSCVFFLVRRNILRVPRFWSSEMTRWPRMDANIILITEIILMCAIFTMNAADQVLQTRSDHYPATGSLFFSSSLISAFQSLGTSTLIFIERLAWWFHIIGILGFAIYITYSKHLHIFLAFPNTYFAKLEPKGQINNMPVVTREVKSMLGLAQPEANAPAEPGRFGAKDVNDLSWNNLMAAYSCTECGRCTSECPANLTGKKLSPRKIMMDTRDRMEDIGKSIESGGPGLNDGKTLLNDYITKEEINACTSCNACVEACPVLINPLEIILELRRYVAMEESGSPAQWNSMFQNIETNFAPWKFSAADRFNWSKIPDNMKSLFESETSKEMLQRVEKITPEAVRQWGKMDVSQMLAHCGNALDMASGRINPKRVFIGRIIGPMIKSKYSDESQFSKGSPTSEEIKPIGKKDFAKEKQRLLDLVQQFTKAGEAGITKEPHPFFGPLSAEEWGKGMYKHLDHHLRQFGG